MSLLPHISNTEAQALIRAAHAFNAFPGEEAHRLRQLAHIRECLAENAKHHTDEEVERALKRAEQDARNEGRREPQQQRLTLAA